MHGRPRKIPTDRASQEKDLVKARHLQDLQSQCLRNHHEQIYTEEALRINANLLEMNPEFYTAWNYRKLAVKHLLENQSDSVAIRTVLEEELRVVEIALRKNCKSYGAWYHRKWVINMGHNSVDNELQLLDLLLKSDSRNFHGWNYRRFIANLKEVPYEKEFQFTTKKINENFSNYSAWHNRSVILSKLLKSDNKEMAERQQALNAEYELVQQALFTDSEDQSGWFYHFWLLGQTVTLNSPVIDETWPNNGSQLILSILSQTETYACSFSTPFGSDCFTCSEGIPIILYFTEPIRKVEPCSINENVIFESRNLHWVPTSAHGFSKAWTAMLTFSGTHLKDSMCSSVKVSLADELVIITATGCKIFVSNKLNFTLYVQETSTMTSSKNYSETFPFHWDPGHFSPVEDNSPEFPIMQKLAYLSLENDIKNQEKCQWQEDVLDNEINVCRELIEIEPNCKWAKLTLAKLLISKALLLGPSKYEGSHTDEILQLFHDLIHIDSLRAEFYKDQYSLALLNKVVQSKMSLQQYCWSQSHCLSTSDGEQNLWLRLNDLSLSRIDSLGRFLWVQRLDISNNRLQSIEGIEALQLLNFLNLSHNQLAHFTALGPLQQLRALRALNIAYNQIGEDSTDITRYSLPSALSNSYTDIKERDRCEAGDPLSYWITIAFQNLHLIQLDIAGNPVGEKCNSILVRVLPTLQWLDGISIDSSMQS